MTITAADVRRTHRDPSLRGIMALLTLLIILGTAATTASVLAARGQSTATEADVARSADLTRELARAAARAEERTYETRVDNRVLLEAICAQIEAVAEQSPPLKVQSCPDLPPIPRPVPPAVNPAD